MTRDIYGRSLGMPSARYSQDSQSWRTCEDTSLWDLPMLLVTLPAWGTTRGGVLFELQMPEHLMGGQECSSLPTPTAQAAKHLLDDRGPNTPDDCNLWSVVGRIAVLPTPVVNDMGSGKTTEWWDEWTEKIGGHGKSLEQEAIRMLPTPNASDVGKHAGQPRHKREGHQARLADVLEYLPQWNGVNTDQPLQDGSPSPDQPHNRLFTEPTVSDSIPDSLSG